MYTPPLEAPSLRQTQAAPAGKSGDNGFKNLLHDRYLDNRYLADRAEKSRDDAPRSRETNSEDTRSDDTRPREARQNAPQSSRDAEPRTSTKPHSDNDASPEKPVAQDSKPTAESDAKQNETIVRSEEAPEHNDPATAPATVQAVEAIEPEGSEHKSQIIAGIVPDYQTVLEGAENTPPAATVMASTIASATPAEGTIIGEATPAIDDGPSVLTTLEGTEESTVPTASAAAILEPSGDQPATAAQPQTAANAAVIDINRTAADTAIATKSTASMPLAAAATKPGGGARTASGQAAASPQTTPVSDSGSAAPPLGDTEGDFESVLTTTQTAQSTKSGTSQPGAQATASTIDPGNTDTSTNTGKPADTLAAADGAMPRGAEPLPQPTAANGTNSTSPTAAIGGELRIVSDASPLTETAAARTLPNAATNQLAVQINRAVVDGQDKIMINLKPGTLGRVSVNLEVGHDNRIIAVISAEKADTLDLLQRDARALERALQEAGLKTDSGSLSFNLQGGQGDSPFDDFSDDGPFAALPLSDEDADGPNADPTTAYASSASGVDIHV